jgi:hypothetical protein
MAIKFEDDKGVAKPARKEVGGKTYVAEEPSAGQSETASLPFAKPVRAEKKGPKIRNKPPAANGKTPAV